MYVFLWCIYAYNHVCIFNTINARFYLSESAENEAVVLNFVWDTFMQDVYVHVQKLPHALDAQKCRKQ